MNDTLSVINIIITNAAKSAAHYSADNRRLAP